MTTDDVGAADASREDRAEKPGRADKGVQVTLEQPVMDMLTEYKARTEMSHPNILFDALEYSYDELPNLIKDRATRLEPDRKKLFDRPSSPARHEDVKTETFVVRMTQANRDVIEDMWKQLEAPSRTAMLAAAYKHYLTAMTKTDEPERKRSK